jgi:hypothetical protein
LLTYFFGGGSIQAAKRGRQAGLCLTIMKV